MGTIEFRHMHGSFEFDDIKKWNTVVLAICRFSLNITPKGFSSFMERSWEDVGKDDPQKLLDVLGLGHLQFKSQEQLDEETALPTGDMIKDSHFIQR